MRDSVDTRWPVADHVNKWLLKDISEVLESNLDWGLFRNATILITGAAGFIGSYLTLCFLRLNDLYELNVNVIALVRNERKAETKFKKLLYRGDISLLVQDVCEPIKFSGPVDYIIHAASQASALYFNTEPVGTLNANLLGTNHILQFAQKIHVKDILFISSLKVYGELHRGKNPIEENDMGYIDPLKPDSCYAMGKRAAETLCASYAKEFGLNIKIVRPAYVYGAASLEDDRVWAQFLANAVKGEDILLKSNGAAYRSFCYISDVVAAIITVLLKGKNVYPYNISCDSSNVTIREFAKEVVSALPEKALCIKYMHKEDETEPETGSFDRTPEILDNSRITGLEWQAQKTLREGIIRSVQILEGLSRL